MNRRNSRRRTATGVGGVLLAATLTAAAWGQGAPGGGAPPGMPAAAPEADHSKQCDSQCLRRHVDQYLAAFARHDATALEVNATLRASENNHAVALGDNAWNRARLIRPEKVVLTDPFAGQALVLGVLEMRGAEPFIFSIRIKVDNNRISESEIMTISERTSGVHFRPDLMPASYAQLNAALPGDKHMSRADLLQAARISWGLQAGTQPTQLAGCMHYENWESPDGGSSCRGGGRSPRDARTPLVDVEKGVVVDYQLEDFTTPSTGEGPPSEANSRYPLFYYQPITFYLMKLAKFSSGQFAMDAVFMASEEYGVPTVFRP